MCKLLRKFDIKILYICPSQLYRPTVATLPWEIKKTFFNSIIHTYSVFQIIYVISEENKPYPPHLKNVIALPCKMHNFFIWLKVCCIPPNVGCDVWQMECQTSNVTANVQSDHLLHGYILPVLFCHWSTALSTTLY